MKYLEKTNQKQQIFFSTIAIFDHTSTYGKVKTKIKNIL